MKVACDSERRRIALRLWLPKTPNAPESLEFLDSLTQYRRHAEARTIGHLCCSPPIP